ncbi:hypothetical protein EV44_g3512 [Erysiphe necator]|uniref:Uncharacterized protein n=1 Tax=Uncinula necator TaxID=52586 RepID=A0A0B1P0D4_UNCNE|nr:hypothetical protein EV44_g3512 [Erysiphe necator]
MTSTEITEEIVTKALAELTNIAPVKILTSHSTPSHEYSDQKNLIVLYSKRLSIPRPLQLPGVRFSTELLITRYFLDSITNTFVLDLASAEYAHPQST